MSRYKKSCLLRTVIIGLIALAALVTAASVKAGQAESLPSADRESGAAAVVYGDKAAFMIGAPAGWVIDNQAGKSQGLDCVMYPKGSSWEKSPVVLYARIVGDEKLTVDDFIQSDIAELRANSPSLSTKELPTIKTHLGWEARVVEFRGVAYGNLERAAFIKGKDAVCYFVFSARDEENYQKHIKALEEVVKSFVYMQVESNSK